MSVAPGLEPTPGAGSGFSINLPGVNGATSNLGGLVSSGSGVASDLSSQVLNPLAFGQIGSSVADANSSMQDQLTSGLNQTMNLLDNLNYNVQASAVGYSDLDSAIANGYGGLPGQNLTNPTPGLVYYPDTNDTASASCGPPTGESLTVNLGDEVGGGFNYTNDGVNQSVTLYLYPAAAGASVRATTAQPGQAATNVSGGVVATASGAVGPVSLNGQLQTSFGGTTTYNANLQPGGAGIGPAVGIRGTINGVASACPVVPTAGTRAGGFGGLGFYITIPLGHSGTGNIPMPPAGGPE